MRKTARAHLRRRASGFVVIAAALTIVMLIGIMGLCMDLARMYIARNEIQAFTDAASIGATLQLNGTDQGNQNAQQLVSQYQNPDMWNFQTATPQNVTVAFAAVATGPYVTNPSSANGVKYAKVTAESPVVLYFMPGFSTTAPVGMMLATIGRVQTLQAVATSGQLPVSTFYESLLPYSPDAINIADPNFGYQQGSMYTLRWPPPGQRPDPTNPPPPGSSKYKNWCQGDRDANYVTPNSSSERGFIDIGYGGNSGGSAFIREAIVSNVQAHPLSIGDTIINVNGDKGTESAAMQERFGEDTDTVSTNYAQYLANIENNTSGKGDGRRLVIVPVNNPANDVVLGFGLFLLHSDVCGSDATASCCAEYVGAALVPGRQAADPSAGAYKPRLLK
jgi:Flp pilus assembly protein TadG